MKTKRKLLFRGSNLLKISEKKSVHKLTMASAVSVGTAYKYIRYPEKVKALDLGVVAAFLLDGCELSEKDVLNMKLGDLFEFVDADN